MGAECRIRLEQPWRASSTPGLWTRLVSTEPSGRVSWGPQEPPSLLGQAERWGCAGAGRAIPWLPLRSGLRRRVPALGPGPGPGCRRVPAPRGAQPPAASASCVPSRRWLGAPRAPGWDIPEVSWAAARPWDALWLPRPALGQASPSSRALSSCSPSAVVSEPAHAPWQTHSARHGTGQWLRQEPRTGGDCPWLPCTGAGSTVPSSWPRRAVTAARGCARTSRPRPRWFLAPAPPAGAGCPQAVCTSAPCALQGTCAAPAGSSGSTGTRVVPLCCRWHRVSHVLMGWEPSLWDPRTQNSPQRLGRGVRLPQTEKSLVGPVLVDQPLQGRGTPRARLSQPEPQPVHRSCAVWLCQDRSAVSRSHQATSGLASRRDGAPGWQRAMLHRVGPIADLQSRGAGPALPGWCRRRDPWQRGEVRQPYTAGEEQMCCLRFRKWKK